MNVHSEWVRLDDDGFIGLVGPIFYLPIDDGIGRFRFTAESKHRNRAGIVHGGMLMTLADRALGMTARWRDISRAQATVQLDVHFIRPVRIGQRVDVECRVVRETPNLAFVDGVLSVDEETVATARGIWKIIASRGFRD